MKKKPASKSAFFNPRVLIGFSFCLLGLVLALLAAYPNGNAFARQDHLQSTAVGNIPVLEGRLMPSLDAPPLAVTDIGVSQMDSGHIDMAALDIPPLSAPLPLRAPSVDPGPNGAAVGTSNAFLGITTEIVNQSTTNAFGTLASGFTPAESVQFWLNGALAGTFAASANGTVAVGINTGAGFGFITFGRDRRDEWKRSRRSHPGRSHGAVSAGRERGASLHQHLDGGGPALALRLGLSGQFDSKPLPERCLDRDGDYERRRTVLRERHSRE